MHQTAVARATSRRTRKPSVVGLLVLTSAIIGSLVYQSASLTARSFGDAQLPGGGGVMPQSAPSSAASPGEHQRGDRSRAVTEDDGAVTEDDGALPAGVTVFEDEYPGVANLEPDLLHALRSAAADAAPDGIEFYVNSGWRSPHYQDELVHEARIEYGSEAEAARWVATAATSPHVSGRAVDIGSADATAWLSRHGAGYGLCRIYRNEPWHFELRPQAVELGCPREYADPTQDPRMLR